MRKKVLMFRKVILHEYVYQLRQIVKSDFIFDSQLTVSSVTGLSGLTAVLTVETELGPEPGTFYQTVYSHRFISVTAVL